MIEMESKLTGDLVGGLEKFAADVQEQVTFAGVAAMAQVIYDEAKLNAAAHIKTGKLHNAIYRAFSKERSSGTAKTYRISWNKRKAPHGHLLEFGTSRAPAYPFIRPAFNRIGDAIAAGKQRMAEKIDEIKGSK